MRLRVLININCPFLERISVLGFFANALQLKYYFLKYILQFAASVEAPANMTVWSYWLSAFFAFGHDWEI